MSEPVRSMHAREVHENAIVIDATCPLLESEPHIEWWMQGGATVASTSLATDNTDVAARDIGRWLRLIEARDALRLVRDTGDIEASKRDGQLGILFHFQGTEPFGDSTELVWTFHALGVRMVQLTYNVKNRVGDGCTERTDAGLSDFGVRLVRELNRCRVVVDCSHTGLRTSLDAIEASERPVVLSHSNCQAIHPTRRNASDALIRAIAESGGVVGINGYPAFVSSAQRPSLDEFIAHIDHVVELVGIDHVGLGIDYFLGQAGVATDDQARAMYEGYVRSGIWREAEYPPPPYHYPAGIESPAKLPALTDRLLERGYSDEDVRNILGLNWVRVFRDVWGR